ncbi:putative membrane protein, partial [Escherichia coli 8.2524]
MPRRYYIL